MGNAGEGPTGCGGMLDPCVFINKYGADLEIFDVSDKIGFLEDAINYVQDAVIEVGEGIYYVEEAIYEVESAIYYLQDGIVNVESAVKAAELAIINVGSDLKAKIGNLDDTTQLGFQTNHTDLLAIKSAIFSKADAIVDAVDNASAHISAEIEEELRRTRTNISDNTDDIRQSLLENQFKNTERLNYQTQALKDKLLDEGEKTRQKLTTEFFSTRSSIYDTRDAIKGKISTLINENKNNHNDLKSELDDLFDELYQKHKLDLEQLKEIAEDTKTIAEKEFCTIMDGELHQTFICEVVDEQLNTTLLRLEEQQAAILIADAQRNETLIESRDRLNELCTEDKPCFIQADKLPEEDKDSLSEEFNYAGLENLPDQLMASAQADMQQITSAAGSLTGDIPGFGGGLEGGTPALPSVPISDWAQGIAGIFPIFEQAGSGCKIDFVIGDKKIGAVGTQHFIIVRDLLGWFFSFTTLVYLFKLLLNTIGSAHRVVTMENLMNK
ncbi:MAG: hypothetical protein SVR94_00435 [Pseudomonadota bacterium]|nr:hypothetical protein [Pseudomonadota bacterium]